MCFSATASFIAGGVLSAVGVVTLNKTEKKSDIPFAYIPLLFGIQQITEGVIWLTFHRHAPGLNVVMTFIYSIFSHVLWPFFVPLSLMLLEVVPWRKKVMFTLLIAGSVVGLYLFYNLFAFPITSRVENPHIVYFSPHFYIYTVMAFYVAATCVSVWCFFAAILSIIIYGYFKNKITEGSTQNNLNHAI